MKTITKNDEIIQELWEVKDNLSKECFNDFKKLVEKVKNDAKRIKQKYKFSENDTTEKTI